VVAKRLPCRVQHGGASGHSAARPLAGI